MRRMRRARVEDEFGAVYKVITHLPADIELSFPFRVLEEKLGKPLAAYLFLRLWADLAFQTRVHGKAGIYETKWQHHFQKTLEGSGIANATDVLKESGVLRVMDNGDWYCSLFCTYNAHLDRSYIPPTFKYMKDWQVFMDELSKKDEARKLSAKIPALAWYLPNGDVIPESTMNRALVLIHMTDIILHQEQRDYGELDIGVIHAAVSVVSKHSEAVIGVVMRRFLAISRPRLHPLFPPTTEEALARFDDLIVLASPDEGYEAWVRRLEAPPNEDEGPQGITRELAEAVSGIPSEG